MSIYFWLKCPYFKTFSNQLCQHIFYVRETVTAIPSIYVNSYQAIIQPMLSEHPLHASINLVVGTGLAKIQ